VGTLSKSLLLFTLNWLDAQLTLLWLRLNVATEGNALMARLLEHGPVPFIAIKVLIGAFAAYILYRCSHLQIAKRGMTVVLSVYGGLMLIHLATGCAALGWHGPERIISYVEYLPKVIVGLFA
jgi:hypothetical protein